MYQPKRETTIERCNALYRQAWEAHRLGDFEKFKTLLKRRIAIRQTGRI